jgi:macrolide-specific efflux system membrane fusion protein
MVQFYWKKFVSDEGIMKKLIFILILIIVVLTMIGMLFVSKHRSSKQVIDKQVKPEYMDLYIKFMETGWVQPRNRVEIVSPFGGGRIEQIYVNEGEKVKRGQIVALISSSDTSIMMDAAKAVSQAEYKKWQDIIKPVPVFAPMDGFVILRNKEPGQTMQYGAKNDTILVLADELIVNSYINEVDIRYIKINDKLEIRLEMYPNRKFLGIVERIAYECRFIDGVAVYPVYIKFSEKSSIVQSGMTATVTVIIDSKKNALSIPNSFITEKENIKTVTVNTGTKIKPKFEQRKIKTGITDGNYTEILSGLAADEIVVSFKVAYKKDDEDNK